MGAEKVNVWSRGVFVRNEPLKLERNVPVPYPQHLQHTVHRRKYLSRRQNNLAYLDFVEVHADECNPMQIIISKR